MKIYDETTKQEIQNPDLSVGYVYDGVRVTGYTEEHYEVMPGTVTDKRPNGLRRLVPKKAITEPCQWYHRYDEKELAMQQEQPTDINSRVEALETGQTELQEALDLLLSGATE